jgi:hypothetical protein
MGRGGQLRGEEMEGEGGLVERRVDGEGGPGTVSDDGGACPTTARARCRRAVVGSTLE